VALCSISDARNDDAAAADDDDYVVVYLTDDSQYRHLSDVQRTSGNGVHQSVLTHSHLLHVCNDSHRVSAVRCPHITSNHFMSARSIAPRPVRINQLTAPFVLRPLIISMLCHSVEPLEFIILLTAVFAVLFPALRLYCCSLKPLLFYLQL